MLIRARRTLAVSAVAAIALVVAAGCSNDEPTATVPATTPSPATNDVDATPGSDAPASIRQVDLSGMPVPAAWCEGVEGAVDGTVTLVDWRAGPVDPSPDQQDPSLVMPEASVLYGDVDGDGVEDAVARLSCTWPASDETEAMVVIFSIRDASPTVVGTIHEAGVTHAVAGDEVHYTIATDVRLDGDHVVVDWATGDRPPTTTTVRYLVLNGTPTVASDTGPAVPAG